MSLIAERQVYPSEILKRKVAKNLKSSDEGLFAHEMHKEIGGCYLYEYSDVAVSDRGLASHKNGLHHILIPQSISGEGTSTLLRLKSRLINISRSTTKQVEKGLLITDSNSHGYFHWITEALLKFIAFKNIMEKDRVVIVPKKFYSPLVMDSLELFGVRKEHLCLVEAMTKTKVENLWIMGNPVSPAGSGNYRPQLIQNLKTELLSIQFTQDELEELNTKYGDKLYISRADAKFRYLENEAELVPKLKGHGFSIIYASQLSFREQIILFSQAKFLISLHGAGLTNMIWMPPKSRILEIRLKGDRHNNCYFSLASVLDHEYYYSEARSDSKDIHRARLYWDAQEAQKDLGLFLS